MNSFAWARDSDTIHFKAPEHGEQPVFKTSVSKPKMEKILERMNAELQGTTDGKTLVLSRSSLIQSQEAFRAAVSGGLGTQILRPLEIGATETPTG